MLDEEEDEESATGPGYFEGRMVRNTGDRYGFIRVDSLGTEMFVMPAACGAFGSTLPPIGTRVRFTVVTDEKTGRPRAEDVQPLRAQAHATQSEWPAEVVRSPRVQVAKQVLMSGTVIEDRGSYGFIAKDEGGSNMFVMPAACMAIGGIPQPGTRVQYSVVTDLKTGRPRADHVQLEVVDDGQRSGTFARDLGNFGFIHDDSNENEMFCLPCSFVVFGKAFPPTGTRVTYEVVLDAKTGRPRAESVRPEGHASPPWRQSPNEQPRAKASRRAPSAPREESAPKAARLDPSTWLDEGAEEDNSAQLRQTGTVEEVRGTYGFITQDSGGPNMFVMPAACKAFGGSIPPIGTRVQFHVVTDDKTHRPRADGVEPLGHDKVILPQHSPSSRHAGRLGAGESYANRSGVGGSHSGGTMVADGCGSSGCGFGSAGDLGSPSTSGGANGAGEEGGGSEGDDSEGLDLPPWRNWGAPNAGNIAMAGPTSAENGVWSPLASVKHQPQGTLAPRVSPTAFSAAGCNLTLNPNAIAIASASSSAAARRGGRGDSTDNSPDWPNPRGAGGGGHDADWPNPRGTGGGGHDGAERFGGTMVRNNGNFGFIKQDLDDREMFVMPAACSAFSNGLPAIGQRVTFEVVTDSKTGRPRAENVWPSGDDPSHSGGCGHSRWASSSHRSISTPYQALPNAPTPQPEPSSARRRREPSLPKWAESGWQSGAIDEVKGTHGFIKQDSSEGNMFVLPLSCRAFGGYIPDVGTRVLFFVVTDSKTGRPRADGVIPEEWEG
eukprot:TRINITY_DN25787_c0_g1_i1.p1 TRINITY_DN25787_c0_g1~~TRINITY_DN25787_c0_g1_i1.p1  ORF type:complete len:902 (-),score=135.54 TRINITY_DN25787_c0_g1_i1:124-2451(-)